MKIYNAKNKLYYNYIYNVYIAVLVNNIITCSRFYAERIIHI
jgi:hypothetical protein